MVWQLKEIRPEGVAPFEDVRLQVEQSLRRDRALEIATVRAAELAELWREGEDVETLAESLQRHRLPRRATTAGVRRSGPSVRLRPSTKRSSPSDEGGIIGPIRIGDRGSAVARVETLRLIGPEEMASERDPVRARLLAERAQQLLIAIVNERRRDTVVTADDAFRQAFSRQG